MTNMTPSTSATTEKDEGPRSFTRFLEQVAEGEANGELSRALQKLTVACATHAKLQNDTVGGSLELKLNLSVEPGGIVGVSYSVKTKEPDPKRAGSIFWTTKGGNLSVENPRQQKLPLREVTADNGETRLVDDDGVIVDAG